MRKHRIEGKKRGHRHTKRRLDDGDAGQQEQPYHYKTRTLAKTGETLAGLVMLHRRRTEPLNVISALPRDILFKLIIEPHFLAPPRELRLRTVKPIVEHPYGGYDGLTYIDIGAEKLVVWNDTDVICNVASLDLQTIVRSEPCHQDSARDVFDGHIVRRVNNGNLAWRPLDCPGAPPAIAILDRVFRPTGKRSGLTLFAWTDGRVMVMEPLAGRGVGELVVRLYQSTTGHQEGVWFIPPPFDRNDWPVSPFPRLGRLYFCHRTDIGVLSSERQDFRVIPMHHVKHRWIRHVGPHHIITEEWRDTPEDEIYVVFYALSDDGTQANQLWYQRIDKMVHVGTFMDRWIIAIETNMNDIGMRVLDPKTGEQVANFQMFHSLGTTYTVALGTDAVYTYHRNTVGPCLARWNLII